jgi:hypothetical protein
VKENVKKSKSQKVKTKAKKAEAAVIAVGFSR